MTKEEVLQKANEYCTEKAYTNETLTDEFKDKFSDFFSKKYPDAAIDDESALSDLKFNLDTAFSATSKGVTAKQKAFEERESEFKRQIEELNKKLGEKDGKAVEIPKELQEQIEELKALRNAEAQKVKFKEVMRIAKNGIRQDLHQSFERYAETATVDIEKGSKEQAEALVARFQDIFKDTIGDIKPFAPKSSKKRDEFLDSLPKMKV